MLIQEEIDNLYEQSTVLIRELDLYKNILDDLVSPFEYNYAVKENENNFLTIDGVFLDCCHQEEFSKIISRNDYETLYLNKEGQNCIRCQKPVEIVGEVSDKNLERKNKIERNIQRFIHDFKQALDIISQINRLDGEQKKRFNDFDKGMKRVAEELIDHIYDDNQQMLTLLNLKSATLEPEQFFFLEAKLITGLLAYCEHRFEFLARVLTMARQLGLENLIIDLKQVISRYFLQAVKDNNRDQIDFLFQYHPDVNFEDADKRNALCFAFYHQDIPLINQLVLSGATAEKSLYAMFKQEGWGKEIVELYHHIVESQFLEVIANKNVVKVRAFIEKGFIEYLPKDLLLLHTVKNSNSMILDEILSQSIDYPINAIDEEGKTCLYYAFQRNNASIIHSLLCRGARLTPDIVLLIQSGEYDVDVMRFFAEKYSEEIFLAIQTKNVERIRELWFDEASALLNSLNVYVLQVAILSKSDKVLKFLLDEVELDVNVMDHRQHSSLYHAVNNRDSRSIRILLKNNVDIDRAVLELNSDFLINQIKREIIRFAQGDKESLSQDQIKTYLLVFPDIKIEKESPIVWAAHKQHTQFVLFLIALTIEDPAYLFGIGLSQDNLAISINQLALLAFAIEGEDLNAVRWLLAHGAEVMMRHVHAAKNREIYAILFDELRKEFFVCVRMGQLNRMKELLQFGIQVDEIDPETNETALFIASKNNGVDMVVRLFDGGAKISRKIVDEAHPITREFLKNLLKRRLQEAIHDNYCEDIYPLIQDGAADGLASDLLCYAAELGRVGAAETLIQVLSIEVNREDHQGRLPIICALKKSRIAMIEYLLNHGAFITDEVVQLVTKLELDYERYHIRLLIQEKSKEQLLSAYRTGEVDRVRELCLLGIEEDEGIDLIDYLIQAHSEDPEKFLKVFAVVRDCKCSAAFQRLVKYHFDQLFRAVHCFSLFYSKVSVAEQKYIQHKIEIHQEALRFVMRIVFAESCLFAGDVKNANKCFAYLQKKDEPMLLQYLREMLGDAPTRRFSILEYSKSMLITFFNLSVIKPYLHEAVIATERNPHVKFDLLELLMEHHRYKEAYNLLKYLYEKYPSGIETLMGNRDYALQEVQSNQSKQHRYFFHHSKLKNVICIRFFSALLNEDARMMQQLAGENISEFDRLFAQSIDSHNGLDVAKHDFVQNLFDQLPHSMVKTCKQVRSARLRSR